MKWRTEKRKISDLIPTHNNPRQLSTEQAEKLRESLAKFDLAEIPAINRDNTILAGHMRLRILQQLKGDCIIDVRVPDHALSAEECREYLIRSNANTGSWDWDVLANDFDLGELDDWGLEIEGLEDLGKQDPPGDTEKVPEVREEAKTELGRIYQLGKHRLMCGDSTSEEDVARLMDGEKADMVFTDPPYNVDYEGSDGQKIKNDNMDADSFYKFLLSAFRCYSDSLNEGGAIYVCHADLEGLNFRMAFRDAGFRLRATIIWNKNALVMGRGDYHWKHEPILYGWKDGKSHSWHGDRRQTTVWDVDKPKSNTQHPTMKPTELVDVAIKNSSALGDLVLDLFGGSGSTLIACESTNRKCRMMELDPRYCDVIVRRYAECVGADADQIFETGVHDG